MKILSNRCNSKASLNGGIGGTQNNVEAIGIRGLLIDVDKVVIANNCDRIAFLEPAQRMRFTELGGHDHA